MKFRMLIKKLTELSISPKEISNVHVHIPELFDVKRLLDEETKHVLLPRHVFENILPLLKPDAFHETYKTIMGSCVILGVEKHALLGKYSPLYTSNEYVLSLASKYPSFFIPFGSTNLSAKDAPKQLVRLKQRGIVGIKYHAIEGYALSQCEAAPSSLEELSMPLVVHLGDTPFPYINLNHARPSQLIPVATTHPNLRILITHFGTPLHHEAFWIAPCYEDVFMDTAEYPVYWTANPDNPYGPLLSPKNTRRIGIHKIIFGTDFPMPTLEWNKNRLKPQVHRIENYLKAFCELPDSYLTHDEKKVILCENIWRFLGKSKTELSENNRKIESNAK